MREILFRGKRIDNGKWVYGLPCYIYNKGKTILCLTVYGDTEKTATYSRTFEIIPETIGQYTGQIDKNGNKIFEGDILKFEDHRIGVLSYNEKFAKFIFQLKNSWAYYQLDYTWSFEVVGNIHDNPELLKEGSN